MSLVYLFISEWAFVPIMDKVIWWKGWFFWSWCYDLQFWWKGHCGRSFMVWYKLQFHIQCSLRLGNYLVIMIMFTKTFFRNSSFISFRPQKIVWHGSSIYGVREEGSFCNGWSAEDSDSLGMASSLSENKILSMEEYSCNNAFILLCIENTSRLDTKR